MQPVRNPQRGEDKLREAQQEVKLRQGASFTWMKAARMGGSGTRVMAQRGLWPNGGPPFTLGDLAPQAKGQSLQPDTMAFFGLRPTRYRASALRLRANYRARRAILTVRPEGTPAWAYQGLQPIFTLAGRLT